MKKQIPITVVNLEKDTDRREYMTQQLNNLGLEFSFFNAIYGAGLSAQELNSVYDPQRSIDNGTRALTLGEIGCTLSHFGAYQKMLDNGYDEMIMLDDDVAVGQDFVKALDIVEYLPKDWEIFLLSYSLRVKKNSRLCHMNVKIKNNPTPFSVGVPLKILGGSFCYVVSKKGAQRMLTYKDSLHRVIDYYTSDRHLVNVYTIFPRVANVNPALNLNSSVGARGLLTTSPKWKEWGVIKIIRNSNNARRKRREDAGKFSFNCLFKKLRFRMRYAFQKYYK
jgi:glycosyl transferase family 25